MHQYERLRYSQLKVILALEFLLHGGEGGGGGQRGEITQTMYAHVNR
jgi:hypothetical protein